MGESPRLPEVVRRAIDPEPVRLKVVADSSARPDGTIRVIVEAQNSLGGTASAGAGRVDLGLVGSDGERRIARAELQGGLASALVSLDEPGVYSISAVTEDGLRAVSDPVELAPDAGPRLLWGDIHAHIRERRAQALISEPDRLMGPATLEEAYTFARDTAGLHFAAVTDHDLKLTGVEWEQTLAAADALTEEGRFVAFPGYEWGDSSGMAMNFGHRHVVYRNGERAPLLRCCEPPTHTAPGLWERLRELVPMSDVLVVPHHTARGGGQTWENWDYFDPELQRLCEVYSIWGSSEKMGEPYPIRYLAGGGYFNTGEAAGHHLQDGLARGYRFGFTAGSESHDGRPGRSLLHGHYVIAEEEFLHPPGVTAVWAEEFTRDGIFDALRARRCYGTTGARIIVRFAVNGVPMGGDLPLEDAQSRTITARIVGTAPISSCVVVRNNVDVHTTSSATPELSFEWNDDSGAESGDFHYLRVTQADGEMAWVSPVFTV
ncbi:MAG: DUF3604 domain-containing protein [Armatimonadetes bacterium]|nr:DUF3604 domain-containing protein [Armatimonadota bacterium]